MSGRRGGRSKTGKKGEIECGASEDMAEEVPISGGNMAEIKEHQNRSSGWASGM